MEVLNLIGGGKKLPALANPATAAQIFNGYQGINAEGEAIEGTALATAITAALSDVTTGKTFYDESGALKTGTNVPYYIQRLTQSCTSKTRDTTCTFTATGTTIDVAVAYLTYSGSPLMYVGLYNNGKIVQDRCGTHSSSEISSVSGKTVTAVCSSSDVSDYGSLTMNCIIISH